MLGSAYMSCPRTENLGRILSTHTTPVDVSTEDIHYCVLHAYVLLRQISQLPPAVHCRVQEPLIPQPGILFILCQVQWSSGLTSSCSGLWCAVVLHFEQPKFIDSHFAENSS